MSGLNRTSMAARKIEKDELEARTEELTKIIRTVSAPGEELPALRERADAFLRLGQLLRGIPAAESERWALNGLDPTHYAMIALKDAQRGMAAAPQDPAFHRCAGLAHLALEHYEDAREAFLEALSLDPRDAAAATGLGEATDALTNIPAAVSPVAASPTGAAAVAAKRARAAARGDVDDWECALCLKLLYEPVATPCAHMFCRPCFARACDHSNKCPACRTVLHVGRAIPVLSQLRSFLVKAYPDEYAARAAEEGAASQPTTEGEAPLPLFVMSAMLPGERMRLHIFEPRYRLLVRRAMEGARRLGMVAPGAAPGSLAPVGCNCEITECQPLPDGRFYLEIEARHRFKPVDEWEQDGYRVAMPEALHDKPVPTEGPEAEELAELLKDVEAGADAWVQKVLATPLSRAGRLGRELVERAGPKPPQGSPNRAEALSFWAACALPTGPESQQELLATTDTIVRLRQVREELQRLTGEGGCTMM